ncbi:carbon storage regulator [Lutispora sp.]|uniref:carbon storage regulator n=1 Tax=Lutispora sp. TaxID=2828727 RepID=UPI003569C76E
MLTRKKDESLVIGEDIEIIITEISEDKVKIGIKAPKNIKVFRKELIQEIENINAESNISNDLDVNMLSKIIKI